MRLNTLTPGDGAKQPAKRRGRGIGSGLGKTGGRGHKGQRSRSGVSQKPGFEGGQMPLQRRLPKFGFTSMHRRYVGEIRVDVLDRLDDEVVDLLVLQAKRLVPAYVKRLKVIGNAPISRSVVLKGLAVTKGARASIESAGGRVED